MTERRALPQRRRSETFKVRHGGQGAAYHITIGYHPDGDIGEIFISTNSVGSSIDAMGRDLAVLISLALQHGCSIETIRGALTREHDGTPSTIAGAVADQIATQSESPRIASSQSDSRRSMAMQIAREEIAKLTTKEEPPP